MQGKHTRKMSLGFAFALLLTLQSLQRVSTQTSNQANGELTPPPVRGIPEEWKRGNEEELGLSSGSITFSGDDEYQASNVTVTAVTAQIDLSMSTTLTPETTLNVSSRTTKTNVTSIQQNSTSEMFTTSPDLGQSTTNDSHVNLTETNASAPNPGNSTTTTTTIASTIASTTAFNITQSSTSTVNGSFTTTISTTVANYTNSPHGNSTNTTVFTTTSTLNYTRVVLLNESTTASNAGTNGTGGALDVRENVNKGLSSDIEQQTKSQAWGAILGIGVGVALVALVIYIIVKRRNYRDFAHRKLVEDMTPEPVLRLDNSDPLDLKFDGSAYYNPGLQGDNIQMTNFPRGHTN